MMLALISYRSLSSLYHHFLSKLSLLNQSSSPRSRQSRSLVVGVFQSIVVEGPDPWLQVISLKITMQMHLLWLCQDEWAYPTPCNR